MKKLLALLMVLAMTVACFASCGTKDDSTGDSTGVTPAVIKKGTYHTTTATMPSNWNELTYQDNNDTQILNYITSGFFEYDYKFDDAKGGKYNADGSINVDAIVPGGYTTNYLAATDLKDVTATVDAKWGYTDAQKAAGGYAWQITLRKDLKWDDGTAIKADDYVYSMQAQLDPDFLNFRADTYYNTLQVKKAKAYFNKNQEATYPSVGTKYESADAAIAAGEVIYLDVYSLWGASGYVDKDGNKAPQWIPITDETVYDTPDAWAAGKAEDAFTAKGLFEQYKGMVDVGGKYEACLAIKVANTERDITFEDVGFYKVDDYSFVILMDKSYKFLKDDGSLSYLAAYYMQSLPLVHKAKYEKSKIAPAAGSTLWTSKYNSSLETTASCGPYKLESFQSGKAYTLVKNDNWFGYGLEAYKNQYNVTKIECEKVEEPSQNWMKFLAGEIDGVALDSEHINDYMHSKYVVYTPGTGTFGMQLFSDLNVLKKSGNNNGILAIDEFRQAISLSLNRSDVVEKIWPGTAVACFGLMNSQYYYDVENGGVYRDTTEAKEGILRAYGFTKGADGKWSGGEINGASLDDAYEALTGYNPVKAKELVKVAYDKLVAKAEYYGYDASKGITIVYGSSIDNAKQRQRCQYVQDLLNTLCAGTGLEGKITLKFDSAGDKWSNAFRSGATQIGFGYGFGGNPFNPFDIVGGFVDPENSLNYHTYWDTKNEKMTLTMPAGDYEGAGKTITMSLCNWYKCLNGLADKANGDTEVYNWDAGYAPASARLVVLAALEEKVIQKAYSVMLIGEYSGELSSPKFSQISYDYNTFMAYGGMRYLVVNYTDAEWAEYVAAHNNDLTSEYKKAE